MHIDAYYDRCSTFRVNFFLNEGASCVAIVFELYLGRGIVYRITTTVSSELCFQVE